MINLRRFFKQKTKTVKEVKAYKTVYCLYRVSTKGQVDKDDIPMQKQACREFAERQNGWVIKKEFLEKGISGFKVSAENRDAIQELKAAAERKEFDVLLIFMFDRLGRKQDETPFIVEWFNKMGVEVWSTKEGQQRFESEADYLINYMRYWQAGNESKKTSTRVSTRMRQLTEQGIYTGGTTPFGYKLVKSGQVNKRGKELMTLEVEPIEAKLVKTIFEKTVSEGAGTYVMAQYVNDRKIRTHKGSKFQSNTIKRILQNPLYCGFIVKGEAISPILEHLQIVEDEIFNRAQEILEARSYKAEKKEDIARYTKASSMLSGTLYCAHCGMKLNATSYVDHYTTKDGVRHETPRRFRYICAGKAMKRNECEGQSAYVAHKVDSQVIDFMRECFKRIKLTPRNVALETKFKAQITDIKNQIKTLEKETESQKRKLGELTEEIANALIGDSKFTPDVLAIAIERCKQKIADNKSDIKELEIRLANQESEMGRIDYYYNQFVSWADELDKATLERKRMIADELLSQVSVARGYEIQILMKASYQQFIAS